MRSFSNKISQFEMFLAYNIIILSIVCYNYILVGRFNAVSERQKRTELRRFERRSRFYIQWSRWDRRSLNARSTFTHREIHVNATSNQKVDTSQTFSCFFSILFQKIATVLKSIIHLKINNYTIDEITEKRTFSKDSKRNMLSFSR
jgi:hypothetical protein